MPSAIGLIRVVSNSELTKAEQEAQKATQDARERNNAPLLTGLARHVNEAWEQARDAKQHVQWRLRRAHRALIGVYDPEKLAQIEEFGGSTEYARITANKIRIVESWLRDVFIGQADRPWALSPTPKPNFPPDAEAQVRAMVSQRVAEAFAQTGQMPDPTQVRAQLSAEMDRFEQALMDQARKTTDRMEKRMADQLAEGGFTEVLSKFLIDLATYPTAIIKGPVMRREKTLRWTTDEADGSVAPSVQDTIKPTFERIDPFRAYPAPGAETPQDGFFIEHHTFSESELHKLIGSPGFDEEAVRAVIREAEYGGLHDWVGLNSSTHDSVEEVSEHLRRKVYNIDVLEYHGPVRGKDLLEWGINSDRIDDREASYEACVWLVGSWVLKAQINYDPLGQRPYYSTSYEHVPGEFWGHGLADILDDMQGVGNAAVRALCNNMAMASGPMAEVNIDRLAPGQDVTQMTPWQVIQVQESMHGTPGNAVQFNQPNSNVNELLTVIEKFYQFADDFSLVPRYMAGSDKVAGAGRTASGLSMLMEAANKGLKGVVGNVDTNILAPMLQKLYNHNMLYDEDPTIKGDAQVVARGAVSLMRLESLQLRRNEFLNITANPFDMQIVGPTGRGEVLRAVAGGLELNTDEIVPPREEIEQSVAQQQQQMAMQQGMQGGGQGGMMSAERLQDGSATTDNFSPNDLTS